MNLDAFSTETATPLGFLVLLLGVTFSNSSSLFGAQRPFSVGSWQWNGRVGLAATEKRPRPGVSRIPGVNESALEWGWNWRPLLCLLRVIRFVSSMVYNNESLLGDCLFVHFFSQVPSKDPSFTGQPVLVKQQLLWFKHPLYECSVMRQRGHPFTTRDVTFDLQ